MNREAESGPEKVYSGLQTVGSILETEFKDIQDLGFTVQEGKRGTLPSVSWIIPGNKWSPPTPPFTDRPARGPSALPDGALLGVVRASSGR